jgi:2-oxoglutarate dehydrogenase E2 component (dihydrolipoamide succinyltransferase)
VPVNVVIPFVGETVEHMEIRAWLKSVGDEVSRDEPLIEITTTKIDFMIEAPATGRLVEIRVPAGTVVRTDDVVAIIES